MNQKGTWRYLGHAYYGYVAPDGELLTEVRGGYPPDVWTVGSKSYVGLANAKAAAELAVTAALAEQRTGGSE